ncbi:glycosyltransferase family 39 protein [uncultured Variovorax sp.]|uniref:glycosyltransferase family 39 protein n=1 Tax=uncultured Variovorax sp. TaxID=114708 RepID=UPI0025CD4287|nr:glycosyltransferase family 39 protein [uncultured Variovorax sp.]
MNSWPTHPGARPAPAVARHLSLNGAVVIALLALVALWTLPMAGFYETPPWDNVEELFWGGSMQWGYYKHPPLPSWLMGLPVLLAGRQPWLTYAAGVGCGVGALYIMWRWSLDMMPPMRATLAVLLGSLVTYHVQRATIFNHNTVQLLPMAGYWWMLWRLLRTPRAGGRFDWLWLGVFAALSMLTKYSALVQFAVGAAFIAWEGSWRDARVRRDLLRAAGVALLLMAPHLAWLLQHGDQTIGYARHSMHPSGPLLKHVHPRPLRILLVQVARLSPMLLFVAWAWFTRERGAPQEQKTAHGSFDRRFLAWATFGPVCLVLAMSVLFDMRLVASWLSTFFLPIAVWAVMVIPGLQAERWTRRGWVGTLVAAAVLHVAGSLGQAWIDGVWSARHGYITRANLPSGRIAEAVEAVWRERAGDRPLKLMAGDTWFTGAVVLHMDPDVQLLIDGDPRTSPWLPPDALAREGGMVLILDTPEFRSEGALLEPLLATASCTGSLRLPWAGEDDARSVRVRWGILAGSGVQEELRSCLPPKSP